MLVSRRKLRAEVGEPRAHRRIAKRIDDGGIELAHDVLGRLPRRPQSEPDRGIKAGQSALIQRRNIGGRGEPGFGGDAIRLDLTAAHLRQRARHLVEHDVDLPGNQVLQHLGRAAIRHELEAGADRILEIDGGEVRRAAGAGRSDRHLVGFRLEPDDQLFQILRRRGRVCNEQLVIARQHRHRLEIPHKIVLERIDRAVDDVRAEVAENESMTVGRRPRDAPDRD